MRTLKAAKLIANVYEHDPVGGNAHIVVDDWNVEDHHIDFCLECCDRNTRQDIEKLKAERDCLLFLIGLSIPERYSALAIHDGIIKPNQGRD